MASTIKSIIERGTNMFDWGYFNELTNIHRNLSNDPTNDSTNDLPIEIPTPPTVLNLYNGKHTNAGITLNAKGEIENRTQTGIVSDWISVKPETLYSQTISDDKKIGWSMPYYFDKEKKLIKIEKPFMSTFKTPTNCSYIRFVGNDFRVDGHDIQVTEVVPSLLYSNLSILAASTKPIDTLDNIFRSFKPIYYISQSGNDSNDGLSEHNPKKTLQSVNGLSNCTILLKSGEEFSITSPTLQYFSAGNNCSISTYGGDTKAIISGYFDINLEWILSSANIYKASLKDKGFYTGANQPYDLCNVGHLLIDDKYNGKRVKLIEQLLHEDEYFIDETNCQIFYYSTRDISTLKFKSARNAHGVCFYNVSNSSIYNVEIKGFGRHGVWIRNAKNIKVNKNYIHHIGGCKQNKTGVRYGNGIEIWDDAENIEAELNYIAYCFDAGITNQTASATTQKKITYRENIVENCWYLLEVFDGSSTLRANFKDIVYEGNLLLNSSDMTEGYRYNAGQISGANFRVHVQSGNELLLKNNICYLSKCYMIYTGEEIGHGGVTFDGNVYIQKNGGNTFYPREHTLSTNEVLLKV